MPEQFPAGTGLEALLPITIPELSDSANIQEAFKKLYYGTLDASSGSTTGTDLYEEPVAIGGYLKRLFVDKANYTDNLSVFADTTSSQLLSVLTDATGTGAVVFSTSPTLVTPTLGVATATSINGTTIPTSKTLVTTDANQVTSSMIVNGTIVNEDISSSAAIGVAKLAAGTEGQVLNIVSGVPSWVDPETIPSGEAEQVANAITFNSSGSGGASGQTFNGATAVTVSYNTVGAAPLSHTHGNITNAGAIGTTSGLMVKTTTSGVLTTLAAGTDGQFLKHDGTWGTPAGTYSLPTATTSQLGGVRIDDSTIQIVSGVISVKDGGVSNAKLANSTISGISLGSNLATLTFGTHLTGTSYNGSTGVTIATNATSSNTVSTIVARDSSGNFSAGTVTAALSGNATSATKAVSYGGASGTMSYPTTPLNRIYVGSSAPTSGLVVGDIWMW